MDDDNDDHMMGPTESETGFEKYSDFLLGLAFLVTSLVAAKRLSWSRNQSGAETTVVTAFYTLILLTSILRFLWFIIPSSVLQPSYVPSAVMAFDDDYPSWFGVFVEEQLLSLGSLSLFSIFILILVYWADILKKYFTPGVRRSRPMITFLGLVVFLSTVVVLNALFFLSGAYSSEAMRLVNALLLAGVSVVCVCEISIFSHRFRTVLKTLGAINQVSTEAQVKRIVWITVTGNLFFFTRAFLETVFALLLVVYWKEHGTVQKVFSHELYDTYILLKHWSEVAILCLMLYILQSRFHDGAATGVPAREGYEAVAGGDDGDGNKAAVVV